MLGHLAAAGVLWAAASVGLLGSRGACEVPSAVQPDAHPAETTARAGREDVAWLIWGRRGAARKVVAGSVAWPEGLVWPADGVEPDRWGRVILGQGAGAPGSLHARETAKPPVADGTFSEEEWDLSAASAVETPVGPLVVAAQQTRERLLVCGLLPSASVMSGATQVVITAAGPRGEPALGVALQWDPRLETSEAYRGVLRGRSWAWQKADTEAEGHLEASGAVSPNGDGSWQFVTAEATFSRAALGLVGGEETAALAVFVRELPRAHGGEDAIYWPAAHGLGIDASECMLCENPDGWGVARPGLTRAQRAQIALPELPGAPCVDGKIADGEWAAAGELCNDFLALARCPLRVGVCNGALYLAARCELPRRGLDDPRMEIFLDPAGDGGLLPRPDDRLVTLSASTEGTKATLMRWEPPAEALAAGTITREGKWIATAPIAAQAAFRVETNGLSAEAKVPLEVLGLDAERLPEKFGMLVRLLYRWRVEAK